MDKSRSSGSDKGIDFFHTEKVQSTSLDVMLSIG